MENVKISIIIPAYNAAAYIEKCLQSILNQTFKSYEAIVVDDGSTDNTKKIVQSYANKYPFIQYVSKTNGGVSAARNFGIDISKGEYLCFIDSDDMVEQNFLEIMFKNAEEHNADMAYCFAQIDKKCRLSGRVEIIKKEDYSFIADYATYVCWGALYKRSAVGNIRFSKDIFVGEDILFKAQVLKQSDYVAIVYLPLYCYTVREDSACHGEFNKKKYTEFVAWNRISEEYEDHTKLMISSCKANLARIEYLIFRYYSNAEFREEYLKAVLQQYRKCSNRIKKYEPVKSKIKQAFVYRFPNLYFRIKS